MNLKYFFCTAILAITTGSSFAQWLTVDSTHTGNFMAMSFATPAHGCITGEAQGHIRYTHDGFTNAYNTPTDFTTEMFLDIQMLNAQDGYTCGGSWFGIHHSILMRTNDGGINWNTVTADSIPGYAIEKISFRTVDTGIFCTADSLYRTFNGSNTYTAIPDPFNTYGIRDIIMLPGNRIAATGKTTANTGVIVISDDWGATWNTVFSDTALSPEAIGFYNSTGWAVCNKGWVLHTTNGGLNWTKTKIAGDSIFLTGISAVNNDVAWACGYNMVNDGRLFVTKDGGNTWQQNFTTITEPLVNISIPSLDTGYVASYRYVYKTTNSGGLHLSVPGTRYNTQYADIWPNPATNTIHITIPNGSVLQQVTITDVTGKTVRHYITQNTTLDLGNLPDGCYLVTITTNKGLQTGKLVVGQ